MIQDGKRVYAVDLARGLAVLFMIFVHVLITYSNAEVQHSVFGGVIGFLGGPPAAPVFMALMGISFYYSRNTDMTSGVRRGLKIILLGYVLNFLRGVAPIYIVGFVAPSMASRIPAAIANVTDALLELDILQFAGLSLIVMAVLRERKVNKYILLSLAVAIAVAAPMLWGLKANIPVLDHLLDYLWGDKPSAEACIGNFVSFPFFPWFSFVLVGMFLGDTLTKSPDLHKTFNKIGIVGLLILIASVPFMLSNSAYHMGDYYHCRPGGVVCIVGIVLAWLYLCNVAIEKIEANRVFAILFHWSRTVNILYIVQWVLVMWVADAILGFNKCSYSMTVAAMLGITVASHFINELYLKCRPVSLRK